MRVSIMAGLAAGVLALAACGAALAADDGPWRIVSGDEEGSTLVVDTGSVRPGSSPSLHSALVFGEGKHVDGVGEFYAMGAVEAVDCAGNRLRATRYTAYDRSGAMMWDSGELTDQEWDPQEAGSYGQDKVDLACKGVWPSGAGAVYPTLAAARAAAYPGR